MTVTGQLLGSPAYMSPEHVEGRPLDFRTDVFAVGIVLYELVVGELPFRGKNPHETLKRIAECEYVDPRKANPLVGNELGRIINRALARDPDDRFADIGEMLAALETYLAASGLKDSREELARFFAAPASYELALRERLVAHLAERGRDLFETDQVVALEYFNRVLTIDPEHRDVLATIDRMSHRRRWLRAAALFGAVALVAVVAISTRSHWSGSSPDGPDLPGVADPAPGRDRLAGVALDAGRDRAPKDAATAVVTVRATGLPVAMADAGSRPATSRRTGEARPGSRKADSRLTEVPVPARRVFDLVVSPRKSEYRVGAGPWQPISGRVAIEVGPGRHVVEVRNPVCCEPARRVIAADDAGGRSIDVALGYLPATITPRCDKPGIRVQIDGKPARLGVKKVIPISGVLAREVTVLFIGELSDTQTLKVSYNDNRVVTCNLD